MSDGASEMLRDEPEPRIESPKGFPQSFLRAVYPNPHRLDQFFRCGALDLFIRQGMKREDLDSMEKILASLKETL